MANVNFIELYSTLEEALGVRYSPQVSFYENRGIQLLPNNALPYIQTTMNPNGVELEDWEVFIVNACTLEETEITEHFFVERVFEDENGTAQIDYSLTDIPFDFGYDLVYLKINQLVGENFYSNPFQLTDYEKENTVRVDYRPTSSSTMQSVQLKMWYWQQLKNVEVSTYYETSTKNTVSVQFKSQKYEKWHTDIISNDLLIKISDVFENKFVYLNLCRAYLFEAIEVKEHEFQENFYEQNIKIAFNKKDVYDPLQAPPPPVLLPSILLTNVTLSGFNASYTFTFANFNPTSFIFQYSQDQVTWQNVNGGVSSPQSIPFTETGDWFFRISHPQAASNVFFLSVGATLNAVNDFANVQKGGRVDVNVLFNDTISGVTEITNISVPSNGTATLQPNKTIRYTHDNSATTSDSFTYTIDNGTTNDTATVSIIVLQPSGGGTSTAFNTSTTGAASGSINQIGQGACSFLLNTTRYHNGASALPTLDDFVYTNAALSIPFNGNSLWYAIANGRTIQIDTNGRIINLYICGSGGGGIA